MRYLEAPKEAGFQDGERSIFLAGGISGCPDWQQQIVQRLANTDLTLINPRRANFPINDASAAPAQISWEYRYLREAKEILFWFPCETLCPIALYELGAWAVSEKPIYVGVHPKYQRRKDVEIQMQLERPGLHVVHSIDYLVEQVLGGLNG